MAAETPRPSSPSSGRSRPIILLDRVTMAGDDRCFNDWVSFFGLPPLDDESEAGYAEETVVGG